MNEIKRIEALRKYEILDTPKERMFDQITKLATETLNVPIALISLVDTNRIWFKSTQGIAVEEIEKEEGLCASVILGNDIYIVEDARNDPRTRNNSLVTSDFGVQFYAGFPLKVPTGENIGTLCIIDKKPRTLNEVEQNVLKGLACIVVEQFESQFSEKKAVIAQLEMANTLKAIYESSEDATTFIDTNFKVRYTNQVAKKMTQKFLGKEGNIGDDVTDYIIPEFKDEFISLFESVLKNDSVEVEKSFSDHWWRISMDPVYDKNDKLVGVTYGVKDITVAKKNLLKLVKQNELLKEIAWQQCHEVRGPVANILGFCKLLVDNKEDSTSEQKVYLDHLYRATKELDDIIHKIVAQTFERDLE